MSNDDWIKKIGDYVYWFSLRHGSAYMWTCEVRVYIGHEKENYRRLHRNYKNLLDQSYRVNRAFNILWEPSKTDGLSFFSVEGQSDDALKACELAMDKAYPEWREELGYPVG